ncbi:MAG TPA: class I SAM-dependent methyltransferase [bacterium]|nr:class I SAM-dependent methyltransferase [bacterium]
MQKTPPEMYRKFAEIYDVVMRQIDYITWESHVTSLAKRWCPNMRDILSVACGTGSLEVLLAQRDYNVFCLDLSEDMLRVAERKFEVLPEKPPTKCACMTNFDLAKQFDVVLCLYDSLNYLTRPEQVQGAFERAYVHLRPGGIYIFDVTTEYNILQHFAEYTFAENLDGYSYIWDNAYNIGTKLCTSEVTIFEEVEPGLYRRFNERHDQRMYANKDISRWLNQAGFKLQGIYDGFSIAPPKDHSERIHFVAQRPENDNEEGV